MPNKNTLFVGKVFRRFHTLPSTNDYAVQWVLSEHPAEGAVVLAENQTAGRGQMGNTWETQAGKNLTLSVVLYPHFLEARRQFNLNQAVALAVRDAIASCTRETVKIKWPNDILIGKRKICGILIQNTLSGANIQTSVVGIGINANQREFSPDLLHASSIFLESGREVALTELMTALFSYLESWYLQVRQDRVAEIRSAYLHHLFQREETRTYAYSDGRPFSGSIQGVDPTGKLLVATERGIEVFAIKEIKYML